MKSGDAFKCHGHDFGQFFLFLFSVLTMLKELISYYQNVPINQTFVFLFKERNKICGTQKLKSGIYYSLVGTEILFCSTQLYTVSSILLRTKMSTRRVYSGAYDLSLMK